MSSAMSISNYKMETKVHLHPLVLFQIIAAYERRPLSDNMTVGTLLGSRDRFNDIIEITNSYTVQHKLQQVGAMELFKLDTQYSKNMFELNRVSYPHEKIIGWYSTGKSLSHSAAALHTHYSREYGDMQPLHLLVDTTLHGGQMAIRLYCAVTIGVPDGTRGLLFTLLPVLKMIPQESAALRQMQKHMITPDYKQLNGMVAEMERVLEVTRELEQKLDMVLRYINDVLARKRRPDNNVGRALYDALNSVPLMDAETLRGMMNSSVRSMLLSITLSSLVKTQIELNEKLSYLPDLGISSIE